MPKAPIILFNPARHESTTSTSWDKSVALEAIRTIARESIVRFNPDQLYPAHPLDERDSPNLGSGYYFGAGGVLWLLSYLQQESVVEVDRQWLVDSLTNLYARFPREAKSLGSLSTANSMLFSDLPVLLQLLELTGHEKWRSESALRIENSLSDPVRELMWGTPGVLLLTRHVKDSQLLATIDPHDRANARKLVQAWNYTHKNLYLWNEELYGSHHVVLGTVHGFFGQVLPLLHRLTELSDALAQQVLERTRDVFIQTAHRDSGLANWPVLLDEERDMLVHYCHGAPGIVNSGCSFPIDIDPEYEKILLEGGELIWQAGPLRKGPNLCHGTSGNGYAFLKLFNRTGDQQWLDRARSFAMHAISQYRETLAETGHSRFSLWTGDAGLAVYLYQCIRGDSQLPLIDVF